MRMSRELARGSDTLESDQGKERMLGQWRKAIMASAALIEDSASARVTRAPACMIRCRRCTWAWYSRHHSVSSASV
jgi:hypothetical protein